MADNVNIIVQDTINDIVVNAAVVVETIDINVQAAVDVVDIVANPNNYVVNINRIIGEQVQSDWTQTDNQAPDYIKNKPTIPAAQVNSDWDATSGVAEILNKPTIPTKTSDLVNDGENGVDPFITAADIPPVTGFVPYTGATEDVNLGEFGLLTGNIEFDNTPTNIPTTAGAIYWNDADGTADLILKGGNVKLQIGQESVIRVVNKTATNINLLEANYQAVRVTGAQGQRLKVDLAQATTDNLSAETIGLVTETINNNQEGFITTSGLVRNINTTGSLQGETWADGDILYLSPTTAGNITKVKPTAPNHLVIIGYVVHAHANQGSIFVKVDNGYELDELHNVKITSAANNNVLAYTSATDIWENKTVETALGFTPENVANKSTSTSLGTSNTLYPTQNAVKVYADTKFTLPALTSGSVLFSNGTTIAQDNANLFWDDTNNRLGIGTATPAHTLDLIGQRIRHNGTTSATAVSTLYELNDTTSANKSYILFGVDTTGGIVGSNVSGTYISSGREASGAIRDMNIHNFLNANINFWTSNNQRLRIFGNGNIAINTTTDAGFKLDVNGTARVSGTTTITPAALTGTAATSALDIAQTWNTTGTPSAIKLNVTDTASNGSSFLLDLRVANTQLFGVTKSGFIAFGGAFGSTGALIGTSAGTLNFYHKNTTAAAYGFDFRPNSGAITATSSESGLISLRQTFSPTSGTGIFNAINLSSNLIINQTGGANGITRGLYINPTLTAAADFRAIETTNGKVIFGNLPTSAAGLPTGAIWNDSGTLKIV